MECQDCFNHKLIESLEKRVEVIEAQSDTLFESLSDLKCDVATYKESVESIKNSLSKIDSTVENIRVNLENRTFQYLFLIISAVVGLIAGYLTAKGGV